MSKPARTLDDLLARNAAEAVTVDARTGHTTAVTYTRAQLEALFALHDQDWRIDYEAKENELINTKETMNAMWQASEELRARAEKAEAAVTDLMTQLEAAGKVDRVVVKPKKVARRNVKWDET